LGGDKSPTEAYYWAKQADQFKVPAGVGRFLLARCYEHGIGVSKNEITASKLFAESSDQGFVLGELAVATAILQTKPNEDAIRRAKKLLENARRSELAQASLLLAKLQLGVIKGEKRDVAEGIKLLHEAADKNLPAAHQALYETYYKGRPGFPGKDLAKAKKHLVRAAELGYPVSQQALAREYYRKPPYEARLDFQQDFKRAFHWASLSASQSHPAGHVLLSVLYEKGDGVKLDYGKVKYHLDEAAIKLNDAKAKNRLATHYLEGKVIRPDPGKALELLKESADAGDANGCFLAGKMFEEWFRPGSKELKRYAYVGFHQQSHHAIHYYLQAYKKAKHPEAKAYLDRFAKFLNDEAVIRSVASDSFYPSTILNLLKRAHPESAKELQELFANPSSTIK
jgi:TPR repeat protein